MGNDNAAEFPLLGSQGLYAANIVADGNCLFNALSDQIYGHQGENATIRARVIEEMKKNPEDYKPFIGVHPGGGQRRNPKRKNAGAVSKSTAAPGPTDAEVERAYQSHLRSMAQDGTWGGNMELVAFSKAYRTGVKVHQKEHAMIVSAPKDGQPHKMAHIAYHDWNHYSSVRNLDGPHDGLPNIAEKPLSPEEEAQKRVEMSKMSRVLPWMIDVVEQTLPYGASREVIKKALEDSKCNIDTAVNVLLESDEPLSTSSQTGSCSTERDPDSDNEALEAPNKKQDRKMSRAARTLRKEQFAKAQSASTSSDSAVDVNSVASARPILVPKSRLKSATQSEDGYVLIASDDDEAALGACLVEADVDFDVSGSRPVSPVPAISSLPLKPKNNIKLVVKPKPADAPPSSARISASQRAAQKKAAQKAARKETKKTAARAALPTPSPSNSATPSPPAELGLGIRTMHI